MHGVHDGPRLALLVFLAAVAAWLLHVGHGTTFYYDEWNIWDGRRGFSPDALLTPINGHLAAVPLGAFSLITSITGGSSFWPYRVALVAFHLTFLWLLWHALRPRLGAWLALLAVVPLGVPGQAWLVVLMPATGIFHLGALIAAAGFVVLYDRATRRADAAAAALLVLGVASSGTGLAVLAGAAVCVLLRRDLRRLWIVFPAVAGYAAWYLAYSPQTMATPENVAYIPRYVMSGLGNGWATYTELGIDWGRPLALLMLLAVVADVWRRGRLRAPLGGVLVMGIAFWTLIALSRAPTVDPGEVRYLYADAAFVVLAAGLALPRGPLPIFALSSVRAAVVAVLVAGLTVTGVLNLRDGGRSYQQSSRLARAEILGLSIVRENLRPGYVPNPGRDAQMDAAHFLRRGFDGDSLAFTEAELRRQAPDVRAATDATILGGHGVSLRTVAASSVGDCARSTTRTLAVKAGATIVLRAGTAPVTVAARRYAPASNRSAVGEAAPGATARVAFPRDHSAIAWEVKATSPKPFAACLARS